MAIGLDGGKLQQWGRRLAKFRSSGLTVAEFCRREKMTASRFYYWSRRIREAGVDGGAAEAFEATAVSQPTEVDATVEVVLGDQVKVRFPSRNPELIASVLRQLHTPAAPGNSFQRVDLDGTLAPVR